MIPQTPEEGDNHSNFHSQNNDMRNNLSNRQQTSNNKFQIIQQFDERQSEEYYVVKILSQRIMAKTCQQLEKYKANKPLFSQMKVFQNFTDRGKNSTIKYDYVGKTNNPTTGINQEGMITIRIKKNYYLQVLKMKEYELLKIINGLHDLWKNVYLKAIEIFVKFFQLFKKTDEKHILDIISIDIIALTFEVIYPNKKKIRFRISYYEYRNDVNYYTEINRTGPNHHYNPHSRQVQVNECFQIVSYCDTPMNKDGDFYSTPRLNFLDDQPFSEKFLYRLIHKFSLFFQSYSLCRGINNTGLSDFHQFNRKVFGNVFFQANKLKNFSLSFIISKCPENQKTNKFQDSQKSLITFIFHVQDVQKRQELCEVNIAIYDNNNYLNVGRDNRFRQVFMSKIQQFLVVKRTQQNLAQSHSYNPIHQPYVSQQVHHPTIYIKKLFKSSEDRIMNEKTQHGQKFSKYLSNFCCSVSFLLDRLYFFKDLKSELIYDKKLIIQLALENQYYIPPGTNFRYEHSYIVKLQSTYYSPQQNYMQINEQNKDYHVFDSLKKTVEKIVVNKNKPQDSQKANHQNFGKQKYQLIELDEVFKGYINQLLKNWPLREIYNQIKQFCFEILRIIYQKVKTDIVPIKNHNRQRILKKILKAVLKPFSNSIIQSKEGRTFTKVKIYSNTIIQDSSTMKQQLNHKNQCFAEIIPSVFTERIGFTERIPYGCTIIKVYDNKIMIYKTNDVFPLEKTFENIDFIRDQDLAKWFNVFNVIPINID